MFGRLLERSPVYALPSFIQEHVHATSLNHICFSSSGENVPSDVARTTFVARSFVNAASVLLPFDSVPYRYGKSGSVLQRKKTGRAFLSFMGNSVWRVTHSGKRGRKGSEKGRGKRFNERFPQNLILCPSALEVEGEDEPGHEIAAADHNKKRKRSNPVPVSHRNTPY